MNRRIDNSTRRYAAWMLLAAFLWMMQPLASSLSCHEDSGHDHSSHDHSARASTLAFENAHEHDESHADVHHEASSSAHYSAASQPSQPVHESCCSQIQQTPLTVATAVSYSGPSVKDAPASSPVAILPLTYQAEVILTVSSRAGPDIPSVYSQLSRSSFSNRAPPFSV